MKQIGGKLDFRDALPPGYELGDATCEAINTALDVIATRSVNSPTGQLAALGAARSALISFASDAECSKKTMRALAQLGLALQAIEGVLRPAADKERKKPGGRPFSGATLAQRAAAHLAVDWLMHLPKPLSPEKAIAAVAACVPKPICKVPPREQVKEWRAEFTRQRKGTRGRKSGAKYQQALSNVRFERFEAFGDEHDAATPDQVIAWLRAAIS